MIRRAVKEIQARFRPPSQLRLAAVTTATKPKKACLLPRRRVCNAVAANKLLNAVGFFLTTFGKSCPRRRFPRDSIALKTCFLVPPRLQLRTCISFARFNRRGSVPQQSRNQQARRSLQIRSLAATRALARWRVITGALLI
jgi:hypothetical protein